MRALITLSAAALLFAAAGCSKKDNAEAPLPPADQTMPSTMPPADQPPPSSPSDSTVPPPTDQPTPPEQTAPPQQ